MKRITDSEAEFLIDSGYGFTNFMGGVSSMLGKPTLYYTEEGIFLPETGDDLKKLLAQQEKEAKEYLEQRGDHDS